MNNQLDLYLQSLREEQATEEEDTIYSNDEFLDSGIPQKIASYGYNTLIKEPGLESVNSSTEYISTSNKKPLSVLKNDEEFQKRAARFLNGVGENDENIIE